MLKKLETYNSTAVPVQTQQERHLKPRTEPLLQNEPFFEKLY